MNGALTLGAGASTAAWVWLAVLRGRFWNAQPELPPPGEQTQTAPSSVAAIIPARDEAEHIASTVRSLLQQKFRGKLTVLIVDDNSTDGTGEMVRCAASQDDRVKLIPGSPLPAGWTGKMWAVQQGLQHPAVQEADAVLLTDADITHGPDHLLQMITALESQQLDMLSEMVRLRTESLRARVHPSLHLLLRHALSVSLGQ